jgi:hypothetical protein
MRWFVRPKWVNAGFLLLLISSVLDSIYGSEVGDGV